MSRLKDLSALGQAVWLDYIRRDVLEGGELARLVEDDGVSGVTSNPAIFEQAIGQSDLYDEQIRREIQASPRLSTLELYESLAVADIRHAADILATVYESTRGDDGYVSLEVSPHLARDLEGTIAEARRLWGLVDRPNLMIKVPATAEGIAAVEELLATGINVNVTLMFSLQHYEDVAHAYVRALGRSEKPAGVASVASFFVSRVDSAIDKKLGALGSTEAEALRGTVAVANSKMAFKRFQEIFHGESFAELAARGARPQRVLWASTSTKNPEYPDVLYVDELIGRQTVNTMPPATLEAFRDHGTVRETIGLDLEGASTNLERLSGLGISLAEETENLQREGLAKFAEPFDRLLATLETKKAALAEASVS